MNRSYVPLVAGVVALAAPLARADEAAQKLLGEVVEKMKATRTFTAEIAVASRGQKVIGKLFLQRPNLGRVEMGQGKQAMLMLSDGAQQYQVIDGKYRKQGALKDLSELWPPFGGKLENIVGPGEPRLAEKETIGDVAYDVIEVKGNDRATRVFISPAKVIERIRMGAGDGQQEIVLSNVRLDAEIAAEMFQLPAGAEERTPEESGGGLGDLEKKLVPVGKPAPAFSLKTPAGGTLLLAQALQGKKAVLINFWFYG